MQKDDLPALSDALLEINRSTIDCCRNQLSMFFGQPMQGLPSEFCSHDLLVASYICGFLHGNNIVTNSLKDWAKAEDAYEEVAWLTMTTVCMLSILGPERMLAVQGRLPQLSSTQPTENTAKLDNAGGSDGMAFAEGRFLLENGLLLRYFTYNLRPTSRIQQNAEQQDLDAIEANPISRWIFRNSKFVLYTAAILIGIALFLSHYLF